MRNILALLAACVLIFLGLGWWLGWYKITSTAGTEGHRQISIDLNTNKIKEDVNKGKTKLHDALAGDKDDSSSQKPPTPGTPTNFRPNENGGFVFPGENPPPPAGQPRLPMPK